MCFCVLDVGDIAMVKDVILIDSSLGSKSGIQKKESYKTLRAAKEKVRLQELKSRQV